MAQLFQKVAQFLANELVTKRLANSPTFMNAAHKTHQHVQKTKAAVKDGGSTAAEQSKSMLGFLKEVREELAKEVASGRKVGK